MIGLTRRQQECLAFIKQYHAGHGIAPSMQEIAIHLRVVKSGACRILNGLEQRGHIRRSRRKARAIEFVSPENTQAVLLSKEVFHLARAYAESQRISVDVACSELLREALGAA